jgi:hypothetical protein
MNRFAALAVAASIATLGLSGCQTAKSQANCPVANILASAASMTEFKAGMEGDPSGEIYSIRLTGVQSSCDFDKDEGTTESDVQLTFHATRAPTGDAVSHAVPYFVASLQDGSTVLNKQILAERFSFGPGESEVTFSASVPTTLIKLANGKKPYDYSLLTGLQLTRQQMDFNAGRHTP